VIHEYKYQSKTTEEIKTEIARRSGHGRARKLQR